LPLARLCYWKSYYIFRVKRARKGSRRDYPDKQMLLRRYIRQHNIQG
jgi:hypothetical protein